VSEAPIYPFGVEEIQRYLPHRAPFLLIDRVVNIQAPTDPKVRVGIEVRTRKNASFNEPHMAGHFPQRTNGLMPLFSSSVSAHPAACVAKARGCDGRLLLGQLPRLGAPASERSVVAVRSSLSESPTGLPARSAPASQGFHHP